MVNNNEFKKQENKETRMARFVDSDGISRDVILLQGWTHGRSVSVKLRTFAYKFLETDH